MVSAPSTQTQSATTMCGMSDHEPQLSLHTLCQMNTRSLAAVESPKSPGSCAVWGEPSTYPIASPRVADLRTFEIPLKVIGNAADVKLGTEMVKEWQRKGMFQVKRTETENQHEAAALAASKEFFKLPLEKKAACVSDLTYSGYIASGEEVTAGENDMSEIFTICKDVPLTDARVRQGWPCHGPVPWPSESYKHALSTFLKDLGSIGDRLLELVALGLDLPQRTFRDMSEDGWHHARVLRFPTLESKTARGIGAHTDYGLLVIATQDDVGGLFIRPPIDGEIRSRNWLESESSAGNYQDDPIWNFVRPVAGVCTVFPGDFFQMLTDGELLSTPHKVSNAERERYAVAYFHEPNFQSVTRSIHHPKEDEYLHYGEHFTNMFRRCYPDRITTKRIDEEGRMNKLQELKCKALDSHPCGQPGQIPNIQ